eukprot:733437-Alexandrium_andersonii.AAC.1
MLRACTCVRACACARAGVFWLTPGADRNTETEHWLKTQKDTNAASVRKLALERARAFGALFS